MATYGTDLTDLTTAESGTWVELTDTYTLGGTPAIDGENFIQGTDCYSATTGNKSGVGFSVIFDAGSDQSSSFGTDDCVFMWAYFAVGADLYTYANSGHEMYIGASTANGELWDISGNDFRPNPYGGWYNYVIDPTSTADKTLGSGSGGAWRYFGSCVSLTLKISKGTPHAVDAIRYGRGEIYCTGTGCTFTGMAQENDYNDGTNGYHRWGLFQDIGGTYLWKGLMSIGQSGTSATFSDSNKTIVIDDTPKTFSSFNRIEIRNANSNVTWTNISFVPRGTFSPGEFEVMENATINFDGCVFPNMSTFGFLSNSKANTCTWINCLQITTGGADLSNSSVLESAVATNTGAIYQNVAYTDTYLDGMTISKGSNAHHAIDFGTAVTSNITLRNIEFTGFGSTNDANDSTVRFLATSGSLTLSLIGCTVDGVAASSSNFSVDDSAGIAVTVSIDPVDINIYVQDEDKNAIADAQTSVHLLNNPYTELMNEDTAAGTGLATESYGGSLPVDIVWKVRKSEDTDSPRYYSQSGTGTIDSSGFTLTVTLEENTFI